MVLTGNVCYSSYSIPIFSCNSHQAIDMIEAVARVHSSPEIELSIRSVWPMTARMNYQHVFAQSKACLLAGFHPNLEDN